MVLKSKEKNIHKFKPTLLALLFNPLYIERRGLYFCIKKNAHYLNGRMLDLGCGSKPYSQLFLVEEYVGVDIKNPVHPEDDMNVDIFYDGKRLPFKDNFFDSVLSTQVFEHVEDIGLTLNEIRRVTKKGGRCLFTVPFAWPEHGMPYDFRRYSVEGLKILLKNKGFEVIKIQKTTNFAESLFQLMCIFFSELLDTKIMSINLLLRIIFVFPLTCLGLLLGKLTNFKNNLYLGTVVVLEKS